MYITTELIYIHKQLVHFFSGKLFVTYLYDSRKYILKHKMYEIQYSVRTVYKLCLK